MNGMHSELKNRIEHWIRTLKKDFYRPLGEICWKAAAADGHLRLEEAKELAGKEVLPGFTWGNSYEYCWFFGDIQLPQDAEGQRIVLKLEPGSESAIFVNGQEFGTYRSSWIREKHHYMIDNALTYRGTAGARYEIAMETYAGHFYPKFPDSDCGTGPILPGDYEDKATEGQRCTLGLCTYGIWNETAYQLYMDVMSLWKLYQALDQDSLRAARIVKALKEFTFTVDFEQEEAERMQDYKKASKQLKPVLSAVNGSTTPVFYAVGNAHLDLAWLWPVEETERKTARTFAAQLRLLEEYPEYKFIQSQPAEYEMCRKHYPELFERIREAVRKGGWIADGAMWVEPDTNMAGGEALIRQLLHGKKYYKEMFDVDSELLWLPDTFGYSAALPQILRGCGVKYLVTQKIFWSYNEGERFPYHYFDWIGMDGSKITSFLPTNYTYEMDPQTVNEVWKNRTQKEDMEAFLYPFGYGDGGGGPARDHIEYGLRQQDMEGGAKVVFASPVQFFEDMELTGGPSHSYTGELYFSAHRGTYTSQAAIKRSNRMAELSLHDLEVVGAMAVQKGWGYPCDKADRLWKTLLTNQFHDILPGSSIGKVYERANKENSAVVEECRTLIDEAGARITDGVSEGVTVINTLSFPRKAVLSLPESFANGAVAADGSRVYTEQTDGIVTALAELPACGYVSLRPLGKEGLHGCPSDILSRVQKSGDEFVMENAVVRARINEVGEVLSFCLKSTGREFASGRMNEFLFYKDVPRIFDAWDIDSNYIEQPQPGLRNASVHILCSSGLEASLELKGEIGKSQVTQIISLKADQSRMEFATTVDWKELHRLLKVSFPVDVYAENAINEIQFGYVERPTHRSRLYDQDRYEVCNHRYSALCDGSHGAAVLNDCKYGISMNGNAMELTLLRAAACPEMRADNGIHQFTYAFTAWEGSFVDCDVVQQGYELNTRPIVLSGATGVFSWMEIEREQVVLDTVKPAEDGSRNLIFRLYESKKSAGKTGIDLKIPYKAVYLCDMLEQSGEEIETHDGHFELEFGAFEIKTIRVTI